MAPITCARCGTDYDTTRETPKDWMDSSRCPQCGCTNEQANQPVARADGGVPDVVSNVVEQVDTDGKELHLHVHYHEG